MRVLYLIDSLTAGGAETSLAEIAPHLVARGVALDVVAWKHEPGVQPALLEAGATVRTLPDGYLARYRELRRVIAETRPDVLHTTLFYADLLGRVAGTAAGLPIMCTLPNASYGPEHRANAARAGYEVRLAHVADALTARAVDSFHAVSAEVARVMRRRLHVPARRMHVVWRGRSPERLGRRTAARATAARAALGVAPGQPLVLMVGRQDRQKAIDVGIAAMPALSAAHPGAVLVVAGREANHTAALRAQAQASPCSDRIMLAGFRADVADLMAAADVLAFPSRWEGLPGTLIEAMALECPIVASDIANNREAAADCATYVGVDDPAALARALAGVLSDPGRAAMVAARGRRRFLECFSIDAAADAMTDLYRRTVGTTRR